MARCDHAARSGRIDAPFRPRFAVELAGPTPLFAPSVRRRGQRLSGGERPRGSRPPIRHWTTVISRPCSSTVAAASISPGNGSGGPSCWLGGVPTRAAAASAYQSDAIPSQRPSCPWFACEVVYLKHAPLGHRDRELHPRRVLVVPGREQLIAGDLVLLLHERHPLAVLIGHRAVDDQVLGREHQVGDRLDPLAEAVDIVQRLRPLGLGGVAKWSQSRNQSSAIPS